MQFGRFDDANREYVITTPQTPYPWINYLGNEQYFGLISNTAGGYSFYRDARLRRVTRYRYNNIPVDNGGRYFYINDGGDIWNPGWKPSRKELDAYECRHGLGYTKITGERNGVNVSVTATVPLIFNGEVYKVTVSNKSGKEKNLKLFSFLEWCLWDANEDALNFQRNFSTGEVEVAGSAIYHKTEYRERRNHYAFYWANEAVDGFDTDRESFIGLYEGMEAPKAVVAGKPTNSVAHGWQPIASHFFDMKLAVGEEKTIVFVLGYVENPVAEKWESKGVINKTRAFAMQEKFSTPAKFDAAIAELSAYWDNLLSIYSVRTSEEKLDRMVNIWNPYQCMVTFNMSRSASYFESGIGRGMGFRDSNQDLLGFVHQIPERARERILDIAATQFPDGGCYHQYQPLTKKGNNDVGGGFNDDPLWLVLGTAAYIKESGDYTILDEPVAYDCNPDNMGTLMDHLKNSFYHVVNNLGPHGLPLIGRADWNDCLNLNCHSTEPGESFQTFGTADGRVAESIFIAGLFTYIAPDYATLLRKKGMAVEAEEVDTLAAGMKKTVMEHGYDGDWFLRAYDAFGGKIGSKENVEGQIFIEPQGMCIMGGMGLEDDRALKALKAVEERLETPYGIVLNNPAYTEYDSKLGEISSYPPGYKENAGIFCHNNPWIIMAETVVGHGNRAMDLYKKIAPAYIEHISEIHKTEPYVFSQMVSGKDAPVQGEAKNAFLTGTAAWTYFCVANSILGIQPEFDGLKVDPCIPSDWKGFTVTRKFRGATYVIEVSNPDGVQKGVKIVLVDGSPIQGNLIPVMAQGAVYQVKVVMG